MPKYTAPSVGSIGRSLIGKGRTPFWFEFHGDSSELDFDWRHLSALMGGEGSWKCAVGVSCFVEDDITFAWISSEKHDCLLSDASWSDIATCSSAPCSLITRYDRYLEGLDWNWRKLLSVSMSPTHCPKSASCIRTPLMSEIVDPYECVNEPDTLSRLCIMH